MSGQTKKLNYLKPGGYLERVRDLRSIYFSIPESDEAMRFALVGHMLEMASSDFAQRRAVSKLEFQFYRRLLEAWKQLALAT